MVMSEMESTTAPVNIPEMKIESVAEREGPPPTRAEVVFDVQDLTVAYAGVPALADVSLQIRKNQVTAFIGPSGCGKSTFIRCFNRLNDLIPTASVDGKI